MKREPNSVRVLRILKDNPTARNSELQEATGLTERQVWGAIGNIHKRGYAIIEGGYTCHGNGHREIRLTKTGRARLEGKLFGCGDRTDNGSTVSKPKPDTSDRATRRCLMCRADFKSEWRGNRICKSCAGTETWKAAIA